MTEARCVMAAIQEKADLPYVMTTTIRTPDDLRTVAAFLHDARFSLNEVISDEANHAFVLRCWVHEPQTMGSGVPAQWRSCALAFANVLDCRVELTERADYYELATIRWKDRVIELVTHYALQVRLSVSELDGSLSPGDETRDQWR